MIYSEAQIKEVFFQEMKEVFDHIDNCILVLEKTPGEMEIIHNLFREVHTLKGSSGVFGLTEISDLTHHAEDLLDRMREGKLNPTEEIFTALLRCFDRLKELTEAAQRNKNLSAYDNSDIVQMLAELKEISSEQLQKKVAAGEIAPLPGMQNLKTGEHHYRVSIARTEQYFMTGIDLVTLILNCHDISSSGFSLFSNISGIPNLEKIDPTQCYYEFIFHFISMAELKTVQDIVDFAIVTSTVKIEEEGARLEEKVLTSFNKSESKTTHNSNEFIRLKKEKLDDLMNLAKELVTLQNEFIDISDRFNRAMPEDELTKKLKEGVGKISQLSLKLQKSVMSALMIPVGAIFAKYNRLVRDLSKKLNKKVNFLIEGEEIEVDRIIGEAISDPIMHLIRNSIDHGIEEPNVRKQRGKNEVGTLRLCASSNENHIQFVIQDDGNGIQLEKVKNKALKLGIVTLEQSKLLSKKEILEFIFHSGFSTAAEITDVSGRGVGMDVVKSNIQKMKGSISIDTNAGQGTEFKIILPLKSEHFFP